MLEFVIKRFINIFVSSTMVKQLLMECSHIDQLIQKGEHVNGTPLKKCLKSLLGQ
jgi:hypothetical protein